jgi:hypothetical protein
MEMTSNPYTSFPAGLDPAIHFSGVTGKVVVWGLEIVSASAIGGVAILIEDCPNVVIGENVIRDFQIGIFAHHGNDARIYGNTIIASAAWQTGEIPESGGIIIANGDNVGMMRNDISFGLFGVFGADTGGLYAQNETHDGYIGLIMCKLPSENYFLPSNEDAGSENSGNHYFIRKNRSTNNLGEGFLVIDGSNNNVLIDNDASGNGTYDFELAGDSYRFGFFTPACYENVAIIGSHSLVVKDCGNDNVVVGGSLVDNSLDPCY